LCFILLADYQYYYTFHCRQKKDGGTNENAASESGFHVRSQFSRGRDLYIFIPYIFYVLVFRTWTLDFQGLDLEFQDLDVLVFFRIGFIWFFFGCFGFSLVILETLLMTQRCTADFFPETGFRQTAGFFRQMG